MSQLAEELVSFGLPQNLISTALLMWESTTTAEIQVGTMVESGASPLTPISYGSSALFRYVTLHTTVRKVIHLVLVILDA